MERFQQVGPFQIGQILPMRVAILLRELLPCFRRIRQDTSICPSNAWSTRARHQSSIGSTDKGLSVLETLEKDRSDPGMNRPFYRDGCRRNISDQAEWLMLHRTPRFPTLSPD